MDYTDVVVDASSIALGVGEVGHFNILFSGATGRNSSSHVDNIAITTLDEQPPFLITKFDYNPGDSPTVTLTWNKKGEGTTFTARISSDLIDWSRDIGDSITAESDEAPEDTENITVTFPLEFDLASATRLLFRIEVE